MGRKDVQRPFYVFTLALLPLFNSVRKVRNLFLGCLSCISYCLCAMLHMFVEIWFLEEADCCLHVSWYTDTLPIVEISHASIVSTRNNNCLRLMENHVKGYLAFCNFISLRKFKIVHPFLKSKKIMLCC